MEWRREGRTGKEMRGKERKCGMGEGWRKEKQRKGKEVG